MRFTCPRESKRIQVPDKLAGKRFRCPACGEVHRAPAAGVAVAPPAGGPVPRQAVGRGARNEPAPRGPAPARAGRGGTGTAAPRRRREPKTRQPMSLKVKLLIAGGCVGGVLLLAGIAWFRARSERDLHRSRVAAALRQARSLLAAGQLAPALAKARRAGQLCKQYRADLENPVAVEKDLATIARRVRARQAIDRTFGEGLKATEVIERAGAALAGEDIAGHKEFEREIRKRLDEFLLAEVKRRCKRAEDPKQDLAPFTAFVELARKHAGEDVGRQIDGVLRAVRGTRRERARKQALAVFGRLVKPLRAGRFEEAFKQWEDEKSSLLAAEDDDDEGKRLARELRLAVDALTQGKDVPAGNSFQVQAGDRPVVEQFFKLHKLLADWRGRENELGVVMFWPMLQQRLWQARKPDQALSQYAIGRLAGVVKQARALVVRLSRMAADRSDNEKRQRALLARLTLNVAMGRLGIAFDASDLDAAGNRKKTAFTVDGERVELWFKPDEIGKRLHLDSNGYAFELPWTYMPCDPVCWAARLGREMARAKVASGLAASWLLLEGPGRPVALARKEGKVLCFWEGELCRAADHFATGLQDVRAYRASAVKLHRGIERDESLPSKLRLAVGHLLQGTYGKTEKEDYVDADFCRQVIMGPYLEEHMPGLPPERKRELAAFRQALTKVIHGRPVFSFTTGKGVKVTALQNLKADLGQGSQFGGDQAAAGLKERALLQWVEARPDGKTAFARPMPSRQGIPFSLVNVYAGTHTTIPEEQEPERVEVWHATDGLMAWCDPREGKLHGDAERWNRVMGVNRAGFSRPGMGPPGWGFPIHVPVYDSLGRPRMLVTRFGKIASPEFSGIEDPAARKRAQDAWLQRAAGVLARPGEASLFFWHLSKYCLDSPIAEDPLMIGRKKAAGEFHQTVYQLLDRKVAGYFLGDCDDLAEFFQVLTARQGKNSIVLMLPSHAACGYVDVKPAPNNKKLYSFIILQTGPAEIFTGTDFEKTLERGERSFDRSGSMSFNPKAVGVLLRFAGEDTRKPFQLSSRIFLDPEYAKLMIRVQSYWLYNYYGTALKTMRPVLARDPTPGNYNEVFGLYTAVGLFDKAIELYERHMRGIKTDDIDRLNSLMEVTGLYRYCKKHDLVLSSIREVERTMADYIKNRRFRELMRASRIRMQGARLLAQEKEYARALKLVGIDIQVYRSRRLPLPDPLIYTLLGIYSSIREQEEQGKTLKPQAIAVRNFIDGLLLQVLTKGFFKESDSFNKTMMRYGLLGTYSVLREGRGAGSKKLLADGPYPEGDRKHARRQPGVTDEDWQWFRVCPSIYWSLASDMLDPTKPKKFKPAEALPLLEAMSRGYTHAVKARLGSLNLYDDSMLRAALCKVFIKKDTKGFQRLLGKVRAKNRSSFYRVLCGTFGRYCGLLPDKRVAAWFDLFHQYVGDNKQYYFQTVYAALRNKNYKQGLALARATARYFPDVPGMQTEAGAVAALIPKLKARDEAIGPEEE